MRRRHAVTALELLRRRASEYELLAIVLREIADAFELELREAA
jgi:hypothetical protein